MPITSSAKKALRVSKRRREFNLECSKKMKASVKAFQSLLAGKKAKEAKSSLSGVYRAIDKAAKRGVIKDNTSARMKSRLAKMVK
ncbi:MAG: 30S ribosomal protein S20 [Candidatus Paceibacterota bacterium]|jgi:small subunit ribosomal protein S20